MSSFHSKINFQVFCSLPCMNTLSAPCHWLSALILLTSMYGHFVCNLSLTVCTLSAHFHVWTLCLQLVMTVCTLSAHFHVRTLCLQLDIDGLHFVCSLPRMNTLSATSHWWSALCLLTCMYEHSVCNQSLKVCTLSAHFYVWTLCLQPFIDSLHFVGSLPGFCKCSSRILPGSYQGSARVLPGFYQGSGSLAELFVSPCVYLLFCPCWHRPCVSD